MIKKHFSLVTIDENTPYQSFLMISIVRTLGKDGFRSNEHLRGDLVWEGGMRASGQVPLTGTLSQMEESYWGSCVVQHSLFFEHASTASSFSCLILIMVALL